ncbi:photosystem I psaG / psaK [Chamaesiphon minutus]|uniref:Photosystem I psaG / psaK n=1 Tax=Chamaesiphon minutus (strain ATCC 27169 / PCC 6605) TaxID=1173020 RepID=K9UNK5_CHAP6|nr:photosystem I psaG / psaK [Chamaesiphon minutus]AFY96687.1 Photosystem I psaG / psaK [Chamaesiphon minutus PCC 6605]
MLNNLIIAAIPHTEPWRFHTAFIMSAANLLAVAIVEWKFSLTARSAAIDTGGTPSLTAGKPELLANFNLSKLIAAMSFGHILGVGLVLGLTNVGII